MAKAKKPSKNNSSKSKSKSTAISTADLPDFLFNTKLNCLIIFCFSCALYLNTINHDYTQDDAIVIYDNMYTTQGLDGFSGILKYDTFKGFFKVEGKDMLVEGGRYRPFTLLMFALEWQLFKKAKKDLTGNIIKDADGEIIYEGSPFIGPFLQHPFVRSDMCRALYFIIKNAKR